ncbi:MAG: ribulose-phosphate 3-epimerase [Candidatus Omnitrophica bacterium]|nr:ribulose-phosphate 3-epimerase [Candidatus Omnitrophota bacterium]
MKRKKVIIAPSILSADFACLGKDIRCVERAGCDWIHVDVMDGHFVPNITIGPVVVKGVRKVTSLPLDVHLMISDPGNYIESFVKAGSDIITVHYEACRNLEKLRRQIRKYGVKAGVSLKPKTKLTKKVLADIARFDLVLIMTVEPGFGGQSFMHDVVPKIGALRSKYKGLISVDGGVSDKTVGIVKKAGVDVIVAGSYLFGARDMKKRMALLRK